MIKIDNLTKLYKSKRKITCRALDGVSVVLPDNGLVFILGKSGSGKSTLLNLIGGLDSFDEGDIVFFGNSLASFSERDYEAYRSNFISFIFQDYHLIDELTVLENITLFNSDEIDEKLLSDTLDTVGMTDYVTRYPSELSGGQKQRVAIARGIVKDPKVILCDEPTGNLDRKTSAQILELLKTLSKDKLVVIVSHNLGEAEKYADRIIELSDGRIISDIEREANYSDGFVMDEGRATLPYHSRMDDEQVDRLNLAIRSGEITEIKMNGSGFEATEIEYAEERESLELKKIGKKNILKLFKKFFFSKYRAAISTVVISVLMFGLFSVIQSFISFDSSEALFETLDQKNPISVVEREYSGFPKNIHDDLSGYSNGKTYYMYSQTLWTNNTRGSSWDYVNRVSDKDNIDRLYARENYGILLCDDEYLLDLYGKEGEIPLVLGSLEGARDGNGLLITDYFADSIIYHEIEMKGMNYLTYESIIGVFTPCAYNKAGRIVGIIDTDYEEKYKSIFDTYEDLKKNKDITPEEMEEIEKMVRTSDLYMTFFDDILTNLAVAYSLNPNYIDDFSFEETSILRCNGLYFVANGKEQKTTATLSVLNDGLVGRPMADDEVGIPYQIYNALFGTEYSDEDINKLDHIEEKTVTVRRYVDDDPKGDVLYEREFTIAFVTSNRFVASENTMYYFKRGDWQPSRVYFKGEVDFDALSSFMKENEYIFVARRQRNIQQISGHIVTFRDLFVLLEVTIVATIAFYLIYFGIRSIRQNSYQIGVIKALGGRNRDVEKIFVLKTFIIGIVIAVLSAAVSTAFVGMANGVLLSSVEKVTGIRIDYVDIIKFLPGKILLDALIMVGISFVSALIPAIILKRIKPVMIIKAKE